MAAANVLMKDCPECAQPIPQKAVFCHICKNDIRKKDPFVALVSTPLEFFREKPGIFVTLGYGYVSAVGAVYAWTLFSSLGVNILVYAEPGDFLLVAFKAPRAVLYALGVWLVPGLFLLVQLLINKWKVRGGPWQMGQVYALLISIWALGYGYYAPAHFGTEAAAEIKSGQILPVAVKLRGSGDGSAEPKQSRSLYLIGSTEKFVLFYDRVGGDTVAVPIATIRTIRTLDAEDGKSTPDSVPQGAAQSISGRDPSDAQGTQAEPDP